MADTTRTMEIKINAKDATKKGTQSAEKNLTSLGNVARTVGPLVVAAFGVAAIKESTEAFIRQEKAISQLEARIKSTGGVAGKSSEELQRMAASLQKVTAFGDEATIEMQALLLTFKNIQGGTFDHATKSILDVAVAMGQDLKSSALQVGKALNDPIGQLGALSRNGITFSESQKELIKTLAETNRLAEAQAIILAELDSQFGGAAEAARDTLGGSLEAMGNAVGDVSEAIGEKLSPTIRVLADDITNLAERFGEFINPSKQGSIEDLKTRLNEINDLLKGQSEFLKQDSAIGNLFASAYGDRETLEAEKARIIEQLTSLQDEIASKGVAQPSTAGPEQTTTATATPDSSFGAGLWEAQAADRFEVKSRELDTILQMEVEAETQRALLYQGGQDLWIANAQERVAADTRAEEMILANKQRAAAAGMGILSALQSSAMKNSKSGFEIAKVAAIAETTINTYKAATGAYSALASIPYVGPALGAAAAAAATAAGLANISAIKSQEFGGGGSITPPSFSSGGGAVSPVVSQPQTNTDQGQQQTVTIEVVGVIDEELTERRLIPLIADAAQRGVDLNFVRT